MSLYHIHTEFSDHESTGRIPDVDTSWKQMEERLDGDMPRNKVFGRFNFLGEEKPEIKKLLLVLGILLAVFPIKNSVIRQRQHDFITADKKNYILAVKGQGNANKENVLTPVGNIRNKKTNLPAVTFTKAGKNEQTVQVNETASHDSQHEPLNFTDSALDGTRSKSQNTKKDSSHPESPDPPNSIVNDEDVVEMQAGLLWNFQIPTSNPSYYLMGPTGSNQPYRLLLPGAWLSVKSNHSLVTLEVSPFFTTLLPNKPFMQISNSQVIADTLVKTNHTNTLRKLFGVDAGFGYDQEIKKNWWVGGGVHLSWWTDGLATEEFSQTKNPVNNPDHVVNESTQKNYQLDAAAWQNFSKFQTMVYVEGMYRKKFIQTGLRLGLFAMPLSKSAGPTNPLTLQYFFKLSLFSSRNKNNQLFYPHKKTASSVSEKED